jgi:hypothetical protein
LTQFLQVAGEGSFRWIGEVALTQPIRTALQARAKIAFVDAFERASQLVRSRRLRWGKFACRGPQLLSQVRQVIGHLLAIGDHFVDFLSGKSLLLLAGGAGGILLGDQIANMIGLLLLFVRQLSGRLGHRVEAAGGVLLLHAAKQIRGFAQAVGRAAGIGRAGILGSGAPHVVVGLTQTVERLLGRLRAGLPRTGLAGS